MKVYEKNPRYLEFRGKPIVAVGSGEHYGAVLNADFDYVPYLDAMAKDGLNQCRVFSGTYRELPGEFGIEHNTLAPRPERYVCPWKRADAAGNWDLEAWDPAYWARLRDFCAQAGRRGVLVEYVLFCFWYNDGLWRASPMHPDNNAQGVGPRDRARVYRLDETALLRHQEAFVRKALAELSGFDNVYVELCNEPYSYKDGTMDDAWHRHVAALVKAQDPARLIAVNYANQYRRLENVDPNVAICNFHYAQPRAATENQDVARVLADDETGFAGQSAEPYRREAWRFLLAGGGMFGHLDYSFTTERPDGTAKIGGKTPGYGGAELRRQFGFLRRFVEGARVWEMRPTGGSVLAEGAPKGTAAQAMTGGEPAARRCAVYVEGVPAYGGPLKLRLPLGPGAYALTWSDPVACAPLRGGDATLRGGTDGAVTVTCPGDHSGEVALLVTARA